MIPSGNIKPKTNRVKGFAITLEELRWWEKEGWRITGGFYADIKKAAEIPEDSWWVGELQPINQLLMCIYFEHESFSEVTGTGLIPMNPIGLRDYLTLQVPA